MLQDFNSPNLANNRQDSLNQSNTPSSVYSTPILFRGKLPNSSYYDITRSASSLNSNAQLTPILNGSNNESPSIAFLVSNGNDQINYENLEIQQQGQQQQQPINNNNNNLEIWSCVFTPDCSHLAWSCGYGLIKIMKWKESKTRKRTLSSSLAGNVDSNNKSLSSSPINIRCESNSNSSSPDTSSNFMSRNFENRASSNTPQSSYVNSSLNNGSTQNENRIINRLSLFNNLDEIIEIDCGEMVWSIAFGSSKSYVKHRRNLHKQTRVNTRFNLVDSSLILAAGLNSGKIRIYNVITGQFLFALFDHKELVRDLKFTKDGTLQLASVSRDETIKLWNLCDDGNMYKTLKGHKGWVYSCDWSPTASLLCSVGANRQAFIWDTENYTIKHTLRGHLHDVVKCEFSPDGALVATCSYDTKICIWDPYNGQLIRQLYHLMPPPRFIYAGGHNEHYVRSLAFSNNGDHLVSICDDKKLRIWSLCNRSMYPITEGAHTEGISLAYSTDSRVIMVGTRNGHVDVYEVPVIIQRLVDVCRKVVNQYVDRSSISKLKLPVELKRFLLYEDIQETNGNVTGANKTPTTSLNSNNHNNKPSQTIGSSSTHQPNSNTLNFQSTTMCG